MGNLTRRAGVVVAAAVLVLGVSACGKGASAVDIAASAASSVVGGAASSVAGASSTMSDSASATASGSASVSAAATSSASVAPAADCKKVRFALHAGLGGGAVHRWIYKPFQAGTFASGAKGQKAAIIKGALAGVFALHEFKVALKDIQGCPGTTALVSAVQGGLDKATALVTGLKTGKLDPTALTDVNGALSQIEGTAKAAGITVTESDPSAIQLATGGGTGD